MPVNVDFSTWITVLTVLVVIAVALTINHKVNIEKHIRIPKGKGRRLCLTG